MFESFGWDTYEIDGHNLREINQTIEKARRNSNPSVIVCNTIKGKGVSFMESDNNWHYRAPNEVELKLAYTELGI